MARITLLVLYAHDIETTALFYGALGFQFTREKHGRGPVHYAAEQEDGFVLEIYPSGDPPPPIRLAIEVDDFDAVVAALLALGNRCRTDGVFFDPDGRIVELIRGQNKTPLIH